MTTLPTELWERISAIELKLDHLYKTLGVAPPTEAELRAASVPSEVLDILRGGDRIGAIKRYRDLTQCDLASAQAAIDALL